MHVKPVVRLYRVEQDIPLAVGATIVAPYPQCRVLIPDEGALLVLETQNPNRRPNRPVRVESRDAMLFHPKPIDQRSREHRLTDATLLIRHKRYPTRHFDLRPIDLCDPNPPARNQASSSPMYLIASASFPDVCSAGLAT